MALELVDITEDELEDILFMRSPPRVPLARLRLKLELEVKGIWDEDVAEVRRACPSWSPDPDERPVISPGSVYRAMLRKSWRERPEMTCHELEDAVSVRMGKAYAEAVSRNDYCGVYGCEADAGRIF